MEQTTATGLATDSNLDLVSSASSASEVQTTEESLDTAGAQTVTPEVFEEDLVTDVRASLTPAQMVERKLVALLKSNPLPVSHLMTGPRSFRGR